MSAVLELRGVSKRFPGHAAVDGISFSVERGSFFGLLGPSGCGKTTTLRLIAGFEAADAGDILLNGASIASLKPYERNVTTVFQNYALFPHLSVRGNIEFGLKRRSSGDIARRVHEAVELVQLTGKEDRRPSDLSGGERQRVALARALVLEPDVLLLDEPLSALDPQLRVQVRAELKALQKRVGITFLFVTHDQEEAMSLSDRIAVMRDGRVEQAGTPRELYSKPATRFVAGFLGRVNWIDGFGVRPESMRLSRGTPGPGLCTRAAVVRSATFLGNCVHVESSLESGETVLVEVPAASDGFGPGDAVHVCWPPSAELRLP